MPILWIFQTGDGVARMEGPWHDPLDGGKEGWREGGWGWEDGGPRGGWGAPHKGASWLSGGGDGLPPKEKRVEAASTSSLLCLPLR